MQVVTINCTPPGDDTSRIETGQALVNPLGGGSFNSKLGGCPGDPFREQRVDHIRQRRGPATSAALGRPGSLTAVPFQRIASIRSVWPDLCPAASGS